PPRHLLVRSGEAIHAGRIPSHRFRPQRPLALGLPVAEIFAENGHPGRIDHLRDPLLESGREALQAAELRLIAQAVMESRRCERFSAHALTIDRIEAAERIAD